MKRILSFGIAVILLLTICAANSLAAMPETAETNANTYLSSYSATLVTGNKPGEVVLSFYVSSGKNDLTRIGILNIVVYREDGTKVRAYGGTYENGLLKANASNYNYSFHAILPTDASYYMVVTFVAGNSSGADTREYKTNLAASHP